MKRSSILATTLLILSISLGFSQNGIWQNDTFKDGTDGVSLKKLDRNNYFVSRLNIEQLKLKLEDAPQRGEATNNSKLVLEFPDTKGQLAAYNVVEVPIFSSGLESPNRETIRTYLGQDVEGKGKRIRFSVTPLGFKGMISEAGGALSFIQPITKVSNGQYLIYNRAADLSRVKGFECRTEAEEITKSAQAQLENSDANDQTLRTYRIAISVTTQYTNFWDDGNNANGDAKDDALAEVVSTLNRSNEVYEVDMAINFVLVDTFDDPALDLIYQGSDPYTPAGFNAQLQNNLTNVVGEADYDIGHLFHFGGNNGNAGCIGCVCVNGQKGSAFSSHSFQDNDGGPYMSDFFDIDYVPHEIGHQMGANHTWSFNTEGTGVNFEPGSGTTIMGYAGITGPNNVQNHSDAHFHLASIAQILNNVETSPSDCAVTTPITNTAPAADAGADFSIPKGTAYVLKASAFDFDASDILTYTWEQLDDGITTRNNFGPDKSSGPVLRSRPPSTSPNRFIPVLSRVLDGELTQINPNITADNTSWETVSTVGRELNFGLTVRDRSEAGGVGQMPQTDFDFMTVTVEDVTPFTVATPPNTAPGSVLTVNWVVGATDQMPINCQNVNILFSDNGGASFTTLAANTPNDGSQEVNIPNIPEIDNARLWVEAADNIFYAVSEDFSINTVPDFALNNSTGALTTCSTDVVNYNVDFVTSNGFSENTQFTISGSPINSSVNLSTNNLSANGSLEIEVSGLTSVTANTYTLVLTGTSPTITKSIDIELTVSNGACASIGNTDFATSVTRVEFNTIDNSSGKETGYSDFTNLSTDINRESAYNLSVRVNTDGNFILGTRAWIDWNQNCLFESNEEFSLGVATNVSNGLTGGSPLEITVPANALLGETTLRVSTQFNAFPNACGVDFDGEVEDYTVNVEESLSTDENVFGGFQIFPNPNEGVFNVKLNLNNSNKVDIKVFDIRGRSVYDQTFVNQGNFNEEIDLNSVQSGLYLVQVSDGLKSATKKIIVE
ncbi:MAG: reprolysin-like metallopeptidase [Bacteroidota bacterium]